MGISVFPFYNSIIDTIINIKFKKFKNININIINTRPILIIIIDADIHRFLEKKHSLL